MNKKSLRIIFLSFFGGIFAGSLLLMLPFMHNGELRFIDSLFTITSASCVTGLIVKNTPLDFTIYGQALIMLFIEIGGFGYMTLATFLLFVLKGNIGLKDKTVLKESLDYPTMDTIVAYMKKVLKMALYIQFIGALVLFGRFIFDYEPDKAAWLAIFHSVSAFNNAGFSLFEDNMIRYRSDIIINLTICTLIIIGGIGYFVIVELSEYKKRRLSTISVHTKIVLIATISLILLGMFMLLTLEWNNPKNFGTMGVFERLMVSFFASVNYRTAGFNSIDLSTLSDSTLFFSTIFMVTGGAPGSTAGGIKVTTLAVIILAIYATIKNRDDNVTIYKRTVAESTINQAYTIFGVASFYIVLSVVMISEIESQNIVPVLFEVASAFGTVGLSIGNGGVLSFSALFSDGGKLIIILLMFMGRIGVLAFSIVLIGKATKSRVSYPQAKILL